MSEQRPAPIDVDLARARRLRRRPEPRYRAFVVTGAVLGFVAAAVLTAVGDPPSEYSRSALFGYLATVLVLVGGLLGGLAGVLAGLVRNRQATSRTSSPSSRRKPTRGK